MNLSREPPLTRAETRLVEFLTRSNRALRMLNINTIGMEVLTVMLLHGDGWSLQSLSTFTGISRSTVRVTIERCERRKLVTKVNGKISLTYTGRMGLKRLYRETWAIAEGRQSGYTPTMLRFLRNIDQKYIKSEATKLSYPRNIGVFT